jgi:CHAD domain-containing protein
MNPLAATEIARLEGLIATLTDPVDLNVSVHTTRTGIKRLRAFLRLARRSIGTTAYRIENGALRDTARLLAPARDTYVLIDTGRDLNASDRIVEAFTDEHAAAMTTFEAVSRIDAVHRMEAIVGRWAIMPWHGPDRRSVGAGLLRTYRRGLVDFETVRSAPSASAFHGWRRRVKYLRYQLELLDAPKTMLLPFVELGDDLGLEHDQTVLFEVCDRYRGDEDFSSLAQRSTEQRQTLRIHAMNTGGTIFDQDPESFRLTAEEMIDLQ